MLFLLETLTQRIDLSLSCADAFQIFVQQFNKSYTTSEETVAREYFCENYIELQKLTRAGQCEDCGLTGIMDMALPSLRTPGILNNTKKIVTVSIDQLKATRDCQKYICAVTVNLQSSAKIYNTIDLREAGMVTAAKDQGTCGSCWAFGVTAVLESLILSDQARGLKKAQPAWAFNYTNLSLSEQFIASNLWGFQNYCNGGNFITAVAGTVSNFSTFDFASNIPNDFKKRQLNWTQKKALSPVIQKNQYYIPYHMFKASYGNVAAVKIFDSSTSSIGQDPMARNTVKFFLSHGVAVASVLYAAPQISYYQGNTIIKGQCPGRNAIDHQVTIAGYGMKTDSDGIPKQVWVIRNSWGTNWGSDGYFYVEQGQNTLCSEMYFYTLMPKYMYTNNTYVNPGKRVTGPKYLDAQNFELLGLNMTKDSLPDGESGGSLTSIMAFLSLIVIGLALFAFMITRAKKARKQVIDDTQSFIETYM